MAAVKLIEKGEIQCKTQSITRKMAIANKTCVSGKKAEG